MHPLLAIKRVSDESGFLTWDPSFVGPLPPDLGLDAEDVRSAGTIVTGRSRRTGSRKPGHTNANRWCETSEEVGQHEIYDVRDGFVAPGYFLGVTLVQTRARFV